MSVLVTRARLTLSLLTSALPSLAPSQPPPNQSPASYNWSSQLDLSTGSKRHTSNTLSGLILQPKPKVGASAGASPSHGPSADEDEDEESPWTPRLTHIKPRAGEHGALLCS